MATMQGSRAMSKQEHSQGGSCPMNVGETERYISTAAGALLALKGVSHGSFMGLLMVALGGSLLYRGMTGQCEMYRQLGINTNEG